MLKRMALGAAAGAAATVPQSAVVWGLRRAGVYGRKPAPEEVSEDLTSKLVDLRDAPAGVRRAVKLAEHFGFGATCGAGFALVTGLVRPTTTAGLLTGLAIWKATYDGLIPRLGVMPPPERDERGRTVTVVLAHVVYGLVLGALMERWTRRT